MGTLTTQCLTREKEKGRKRTLWGSHFMDSLFSSLCSLAPKGEARIPPS